MVYGKTGQGVEDGEAIFGHFFEAIHGFGFAGFGHAVF